MLLVPFQGALLADYWQKHEIATKQETESLTCCFNLHAARDYEPAPGNSGRCGSLQGKVGVGG